MIALLDDYGFADTTPTRKIEALTSAVAEICSLHPWDFLVKEDAAVTLSDRDPSMPADFDKVKTFTIPSLPRRLHPTTVDTLTKRVDSLTTTGVPIWYYFIGETLYIYPVPTTSYTATLTYYRKQATLVVGGTEASIIIPPKHHRVIAYRALIDLYDQEDDPELADRAETRYNRRLAFMNADATKQFDRDERIYDLDYFEDVGFGWD